MSSESTVGQWRPTDVSQRLASRGLHANSVRPENPQTPTRLSLPTTPRAYTEPRSMSSEVPYGSLDAMLRRYPLLTAEQEVMLFQAKEQGRTVADLQKDFIDENSPFRKSVAFKDTESFERLLDESNSIDHVVANCNLKWAAKIAQWFDNPTVDYESRVHVGYEGLLEAARKFDISKGYKFSTFSKYDVIKSIQREIAQNGGRSIQLSTNIEEALVRARRVAEDFLVEHGHLPTQEEWLDDTIFNKVDGEEKKKNYIKKGSAEAAIELLSSGKLDLLSLDVPVQEDASETFGSFLVDSEQDVEETVMTTVSHQALHSTLSELPEEEKNMLLMRFGFGGEGEMTFEAIGERMGIGREKVRKTLLRVQEQLGKNPVLQGILEGTDVEASSQSAVDPQPVKQPSPKKSTAWEETRREREAQLHAIQQAAVVPGRLDVALSSLTPKERTVIGLLAGLDGEVATPQQIIDKYGMSKTNVSITKKSALEKLSKHLEPVSDQELQQTSEATIATPEEPAILIFGAGAPGTEVPAETTHEAYSPEPVTSVVFVDSIEDVLQHDGDTIEVDYDDYGLAI